MAEIKLNIIINNGYNAQSQAEEEPQARNQLSITCYRECEGQEQHRKLRESVSRFRGALPESSYKVCGSPYPEGHFGVAMLSPAPEGQEEKQVLGMSEVQWGPLQGTGAAMWNCRGGGELSVPLLWCTLGGEVRGLLASGFRQPLLVYVPSAVGTVGARKAWFLSTHHPQEALAQLSCYHRSPA